MNDIINYMPYSIKINKNDELKYSDFIESNYIIRNDSNGNIILNYILDEFIRLLNYNTSKANKTNIAHFIIDLISIMFDTYNFEVHFYNKELNHYYQTRYVSEFYLETQNSDIMVDAIDYYEQQINEEAFGKLSEEEQAKIKDKIYDDEEETQALDIGDDVLDEEGRFDLYSNYNYVGNINKMIQDHVLAPGTYYD